MKDEGTNRLEAFLLPSVSQSLGDTVNAGLGTLRVGSAAGRTGRAARARNADRADHVGSRAYGKSARRRGDLVEVKSTGARRAARRALAEIARRLAVGEGGVGLVQAVLHAVRAGSIVAQYGLGTGGVIQHGDRDPMAL